MSRPLGSVSFVVLFLITLRMLAQEDAYRISLPWWNFAALRPELLKIFNSYGLKPGSSLAIGQTAAELLKQSKRSAEGYKCRA